MRLRPLFAIPIIIAITAGAIVLTWPKPSLDVPPIEEPVFELGGSWDEVAPGMERIEWRFLPTRYARIVAYRLDPAAFDLKVGHGEPQTPEGWREESGAALAVNGVYFHSDQLPSGFMIAGGQRVGERIFDLDKSGYAILSPALRFIDTLELDMLETNGVIEAVQSFPFLVKPTGPHVKEDSGLLARRTFIGADTDGRPVIGVVPDRNVSLYRLAQLLVDMPIEWEYAINLDGGPSTGLSASLDGFSEEIGSYDIVPNAILVMPKSRQ